VGTDVFLDYFREGRLSVKRTMLEIGAQMLQRVLQRTDPSFTLQADCYKYEEYREDELSIFIGWIQMQSRKLEKEASIYQGYSDEHGTRILEIPENLMYIRKRDNTYTVFSSAWNDFIRMHKEFPYRNMSLFAHAFPNVLEISQRKFREPDKPGKPRTTYYVLLVKSEYEEPEEVEAEEDQKQKKLGGIET